MELTIKQLRRLIEDICTGRQDCMNCPIVDGCDKIDRSQQPTRWMDDQILELAKLIVGDVE